MGYKKNQINFLKDNNDTKIHTSKNTYSFDGLWSSDKKKMTAYEQAIAVGAAFCKLNPWYFEHSLANYHKRRDLVMTLEKQSAGSTN